MTDTNDTLGEPVHLRLLRAELHGIERLLDERDVRYQQRWESQQAAITDAVRAVDKRFDGVNEFRAALSDQTATFMPRAEVESRIAALSAQLDEDRRRLDVNTGQSQGIATGWRFLVGAVTLAGALIAIVVAITTHH